MVNEKIMSFDEFAKGDSLQDPKKHASSGGGVEKPKEKFVDQVKAASLTVLDTTEPDYSKVNEDADSASAELQALVPKIQAATETLDKAQTELNSLRIREAQLQQEINSQVTTTTTTMAPAQSTTPQVPAATAQPATPPAMPAPASA